MSKFSKKINRQPEETKDTADEWISGATLEEPETAASNESVQQTAQKPLINIQKKETRTKKFVVVMKPSLHDKLKAAAKASGVSVNEFINQLVDQCV